MNAFRSFLTPGALALLLAVGLAGCDAADADPDPSANVSAAEDAAVSIAAAVALDGGGALDVAASAAADGDDGTTSLTGGDGPFYFGCAFELVYDGGTQTWSQRRQCERGDPDGLFYARFSRASEYQFLDAYGDPQPFPDGAASKHFTLLSGEGVVIRPRFRHALLDVGAVLDVTDLQSDLVTVNGVYDRSATDTLSTFNAERTLVYDLDLSYVDVRGPRGGDWTQNVSGTIEGQYDAVRTFTGPFGTRRDEIHEAFTITFGDAADSDMVLRVGGETFHADPVTGEVEDVE